MQEYVKLKRENDLAQTEIKGHMRVEDDLKVELAEVKADLADEAPARFQLQAALGRAQDKWQKAQARIAELEKDAARLAFIEQTLSDNAGDGLEVYPLGAEMDDAYEKITRWICFHHDNEGATFREALDAAILKDRA